MKVRLKRHKDCDEEAQRLRRQYEGNKIKKLWLWARHKYSNWLKDKELSGIRKKHFDFDVKIETNETIKYNIFSIKIKISGRYRWIYIKRNCNYAARGTKSQEERNLFLFLDHQTPSGICITLLCCLVLLYYCN